MDPIIPQSQEPQYQAPTPPPKHFLNKKFAITFVILILLGAGAYAGIWYWQNQQVAQEVAPTFTPRPSATADPTADWKTYTNTQYGFEVKYPLDWFHVDCFSSYVGFSYLQSKLPNCETGGDQPHVNIKIIQGGSMGKSISYAEGLIKDYSKTEIKISGNVTAIKYTGVTNSVEGPGPRNGTEIIETLFSYNNNIYQVYYYGLDGKDYSQIFDQILSTFKFIP